MVDSDTGSAAAAPESRSRRESTLLERAQLVALELIRREVANLPMATAMNATRTLADRPGTKTRGGVPPFAGGAPDIERPAVDRSGGLLGFAKSLAGDLVRNLTIRDPAGKPDRSADPRGDWRGPAVPPAYRGPDVGEEAEKKRGLLGRGVGVAAGLPGRAVGAVKDTGAAAFGMLAGKFAAMLGPLAIFGQILQANNSGFQVLGTAVKVLTATLAPILFPIVVAIAGAMVDLSDEIQTKLMPVLKDWMRFVFSTLVPVLQWVVDAFMAVIDAGQRFVNWIDKATLGSGKQFAKDGGAVTYKQQIENDAWLARAKREMAETGQSAEEYAKERLPAEHAARFKERVEGAERREVKPGSAEPSKRKGIDDVLTSFRMSFAPKAQFSGLAQVGQQSQLAALNNDPLDAQILKANLRTADLAEGAWADIKRWLSGAPYKTGS